MQGEQQNEPVGIKTTTTASVGLGGSLVGICSLLPEQYKNIGLVIIPIISPVLSFFGVYLYNKLIESPEVAGYRAKLKRDLVNLRNLYNDDLVTDYAKEQAKHDYSATKLMLANLGRDQIVGKINPKRISTSDNSLNT